MSSLSVPRHVVNVTHGAVDAPFATTHSPTAAPPRTYAAAERIAAAEFLRRGVASLRREPECAVERNASPTASPTAFQDHGFGQTASAAVSRTYRRRGGAVAVMARFNDAVARAAAERIAAAANAIGEGNR